MRQKKLWISIGVILLITILAILFFMKYKGTSPVGGAMDEEMEVLVQEVTEEVLEETILVTGKIVPEDEQKVYIDAEKGEIKEFLVEENGKVKKGDSLFTYDETALNREHEAAVRGRKMIENNVSQIQNQINQLVKQKENMQKNRMETVTVEKMVNGEIVEEKVQQQVISDEEINQVQLDINQLSIELDNAKSDVADAESEVKAIEEQKKGLTVKSKMDGIVVKLNKNMERSEGGTEPLVHIVSSKPFKVIGTMSEFDAVKIKDGQPVAIIPKVFKDQVFTGEVETVSQHPMDDGTDGMDFGMGDSNVTMYPFTVKITDKTEELRQGFHVTMEVSVGGDEKKVVVPHSAIMDDMMYGGEEDDFSMMDEMFGSGGFDMEDEASFVYVYTEGVLERRDIETGKMSDEFVEIVSGVELGELIVISPTMEMYDGMEVTTYDDVE